IHEAEGMGYMWDSLVKVANAVKQAFDAKGINIDQNNGAVAGQEVLHMHFHVTPRYTGDEIELDYDREELKNGKKIAGEIRDRL
ncbi:MAG: HIT family protein, partial [Candidatus Aenigmatarchaeota archaeon]